MQKNVRPLTAGWLIIFLLSLIWPSQPVAAQATPAAQTTSQTTGSAAIVPIPTPPPLTQGSVETAVWADPNDSDLAAWPTLQQIQAKAYVVMDRLTGKVILSKSANTLNYPASTTKIMTALLALEQNDLDRPLTVSAAAVKLDWDASRAGFVAGEIVTMRDTLAGLMLPSGNEAAIALAENIGGSQAKFAKMMNNRAKAAGATKTKFVNPNGLHLANHVTTALDMAKIAAAAMRLPQFRELVNTPVYALAATNKHPLAGWQILVNTNNRLLLADASNYRSSLLTHIMGIKTGTTTPAGNCLVTAAETRDGAELVCVLFGVPAGDSQGNTSSYSRTLLETAAKKAAAMEGNVHLVTAGQPLTIPDSTVLMIPQASLTLTAAAGLNLNLNLATPDLLRADAGLVTEIQLIQDGTVVAAVPATFANPTPTPAPTSAAKPTQAGQTSGTVKKPDNGTAASKDSDSLWQAISQFIGDNALLLTILAGILLVAILIVVYVLFRRRQARGLYVSRR